MPVLEQNDLPAFIFQSWSGARRFDLPSLAACTAKCAELWDTSLGLNSDEWLVIQPDGTRLYEWHDDDGDQYREAFETLWITEAERQTICEQGGTRSPTPPPMMGLD